jgi:hypothetical protein
MGAIFLYGKAVFRQHGIHREKEVIRVVNWA